MKRRDGCISISRKRLLFAAGAVFALTIHHHHHRVEALMTQTSQLQPSSRSEATCKPTAKSRMPTRLSVKAPGRKELPLDVLERSYGERSRPFRRDFFDHEKWVYHRAPNRQIRNISTLLSSGIVRQLLGETLLITFVATVIVVYNALFVAGYEDFAGLHHAALGGGDPTATGNNKFLLMLPLEPFTLSSPSLSLLLVFRTNSAYKRWDEARKAWGVIVNNSRTILRQTSSWISKADVTAQEKQRLMKRVADAVWLFARAEQRHLMAPHEDEVNYRFQLRERLSDTLADDMIYFERHRPSRALYEMSSAINEIPIEMFRRVSVDESVSHLCDAMGGCDRIYGSPVPVFYTRHAARFLEFWLLFMPFCLYGPLGNSWNHVTLIPTSALIAFFLLGIDELAIQLEEPFSVLPLSKIADGIGKSAEEHVQWLDELLEREGQLSTTNDDDKRS